MGARMFTALVPPPTVLHDLEDFVEPRRDADGNVRWSAVDSWHVTTSFMAAVSSGRLDRLVEGLADVARAHSSLEVVLEGAGAFPDALATRVLHLHAQPEAELGRLAAACRAAAVRAGVQVDGATYRPHLTLARLRRPADSTRWLRVLDACPPARWHARDLLLIESHLRDRTHRYEVVERFSLAGSSR